MKASPEPESDSDGWVANDPVTRTQATDALAALLRWEGAGGTWALRSGEAGSTVVNLITCDGGEVMGELVSSSPEFIAYVRAGAEDGPDQ